MIGAFIIKADFSQIAIFGLQPRGVSGAALIWYFGGIVIALLLMFELSYSVDKGKRNRRCKQIESEIPSALCVYHELQPLLDKHEVKISSVNSAMRTSSAKLAERFSYVRDYAKTMHQHHRIDKLLHNADIYSVRGGVALSIIALLSSLYPDWGISINSMPPG